MTILISGMKNLVGLCFGDTPKHKVGSKVLVCTIDGCMAEILTPVYEGVIVAKTRISCSNLNTGDGKIPGIDVRITDPMKTGCFAGTIKSELSQRLRILEDGRLIIAN